MTSRRASVVLTLAMVLLGLSQVVPISDVVWSEVRTFPGVTRVEGLTIPDWQAVIADNCGLLSAAGDDLTYRCRRR